MKEGAGAACSTPLAPTGTSCNDNDPLCINGACCGAGSQVVNGGCFVIAITGLIQGCPDGCVGTGSVVGSGNFLCTYFNGNGAYCTSNQDCPVGQACALAGSISGDCITPCH